MSEHPTSEDGRRVEFPHLQDQQVLDQLAESWSRFVRATNDTATQIAEAMRPIAASLREAGLLPEEAPEEPRARALWMRHHRNTGPAKSRPDGFRG